MIQGKRMYKVVCPVELKDGGTYWMRLGSGFDNKDHSINIYLNAFPVGQKEVKLQIRELTDEEMRERAEKRSTYQVRGAGRADDNGLSGAPPATASDVPF